MLDWIIDKKVSKLSKNYKYKTKIYIAIAKNMYIIKNRLG